MPDIIVRILLEEKLAQYNTRDFIEEDPVSIPHLFSDSRDIEIAGFLTAILSWGKRKIILNKCRDLMDRMDNSPYDFIKNSTENDLKSLLGFKHRTFNDFDLFFSISFLKKHYTHHQSLESAFLIKNNPDENIKQNLIEFKKYVFEEADQKIRTEKHIPSPINNSSCKRLNMFLRWMVRKDNNKVDFGIWEQLHPGQLIIPCDVHVSRIAGYLNLTQRKIPDWKMAEEITNYLKELDPKDPTKYDFALFCLGIEEYFTKIVNKRGQEF